MSSLLNQRLAHHHLFRVRPIPLRGLPSRRKNSTMQPAVRLVEVKLTTPRMTARSVSAAAKWDSNPSAVLIRSAVCVRVKVIRRRSAQTLSLFLRARKLNAAKRTAVPPLAAKTRRPLYVPRQASIVMNQMVRGVVVRLFGRWKISR